MSTPQASDVSYIMSQAIFHNNITLLEELLENGADPNFPNTYGDCPLHEAAQYGQRECVSLLLTHKGQFLRKRAIRGVAGASMRSTYRLHYICVYVLK